MESTKVVFKNSVYGEVLLFSNEKQAGKMDISVSDGKLTVFHTEVNSEYEGQGFAKLLLNQLVSYAKEHQLKIVPLCPYVLLQFKRHPGEYDDVWLKEE